VLDY